MQKTSITTSGNSMAIRLPKEIVQKYDFQVGEIVRLFAKKDHLLLKPSQHTRSGWEEKYAKSAQQEQIDNVVDHSFDVEEWTW